MFGPDADLSQMSEQEFKRIFLSGALALTFQSRAFLPEMPKNPPKDLHKHLDGRENAALTAYVNQIFGHIIDGKGTPAAMISGMKAAYEEAITMKNLEGVEVYEESKRAGVTLHFRDQRRIIAHAASFLEFSYGSFMRAKN